MFSWNKYGFAYRLKILCITSCLHLPSNDFCKKKIFEGNWRFATIFLILWFYTARRTRSLYVIWVLLLKPSKRNKHSLFYRLILHTLHPGKAPHLSQHKIFMTNNQAHSQHKKYIPVVEENIIFAQCLLISPLHASCTLRKGCCPLLPPIFSEMFSLLWHCIYMTMRPACCTVL